jgi:uncharacterized protein (UPF0332 family)
MSPEAVDYFETAKLQLQEAEEVLAAGLYRVAARLAYDVALSSARAIIFEKTQQAPKTHSGVRNQLAKLEHEGLPLEDGLLKFLADGFEIKVDFDYGPFTPSSKEKAEHALARARAFLAAARAVCG